MMTTIIGLILGVRFGKLSKMQEKKNKRHLAVESNQTQSNYAYLNDNLMFIFTSFYGELLNIPENDLK